MNKLHYIVILFILTQNLFGQSTGFPKGGYKTFNELKNKKPSIPFDFIIQKRTKSEIKMFGGSDYKIISTNNFINNKFIKKQIYAISTGDTLYINCFLQQAQTWYSKVISEGLYLVFYGPINNGEVAVKSSQGNNMGAIGRAIKGEEIASLRELYMLDLKAYGIAKPLNSVRLRKILRIDPVLLNQYESEPAKKSKETMLKYLIIINREPKISAANSKS